MNWAPYLRIAEYAIKSFMNSRSGSVTSNSKQGENKMPITMERICRVLDDAGAVYNKIPPASDGQDIRIVLKFDKDDKLKRDTYIVLAIQGNMLTLAGTSDFTLNKNKIPDAIIFCNLWNINNYIPAASVTDEGSISASWCHFIDIDVSDEYIRENMIIVFMSNAYRFYCDFLNHFA